MRDVHVNAADWAVALPCQHADTVAGVPVSCGQARVLPAVDRRALLAGLDWHDQVAACDQRGGVGCVVVGAHAAAFASSSAIRASAMATYSASISQPMKFKPSRTAALPVEPLPENGSRTVPPVGVTRRHR